MGYLKDNGKYFTYADSKQHQEYVKTHGIIQFINLYKNHKNRVLPIPSLKWGHESEYHLIHVNPEKKQLYPCRKIYEIQEEYTANPLDPTVMLAVEYAASMIQAIPSKPNESLDPHVIANIEKNFTRERNILKEWIKLRDQSIRLLSTGTVPIFGAGYSEEEQKINPQDNDISYSQYSVDANISPHSRFQAMSANIRERRGKNVYMAPKLFIDEETKADGLPTNQKGEPVIHMDSQLFGMGSNSLQLTYETSTINHARYLHDMLLPLGPLFLALSANSPLYRGMISQIDTRWSVIAGSVDSRTQQEMNPESPNYINKSRYSGMNHYISTHQYVKQEYTDTPQLKANPAHLEMLKEAGVDDVLASHIAQLFVHDAMIIFPDRLEVDDTTNTNHFESLQSTNWNSMRFKPPPSMDSEVGWRVEFRTMDLQLTNYENAALTVIMSMIVNVCNFFNVDFIMPISKVDENFDRAEQMNAAVDGKFWFKVHKNKKYHPSNLAETDFLKSEGEGEGEEKVESEFRELSLSEIFGGYKAEDGFEFPGLFCLIRQLYKFQEISKEDQLKICSYMCYMGQRIKGQNKTGAQWVRKFVREHPSYKKNSLVPEEVLYDLYTSEKINNEWRDFQGSSELQIEESPKKGGLCFKHSGCQFQSSQVPSDAVVA